MAAQDDLYKQAAAECGPALKRLAHGYEADLERRRDLLQDIHIALWRSLRLFDGRCMLQTWVYRVAHNVAASHITRRMRNRDRLVDLDALESEPAAHDGQAQMDQQYSLSKLFERIYLLKPLDRQIILLYLEGESAAAISAVTGLSPSNIATKIHRLKRLLSRESGQGQAHAKQ